MSDDKFDQNPYRSPEWSGEPMAADSGLLTKPIHLKGTLSLNEVRHAHNLGPGIAALIIACFLLGIGLLVLGIAIYFATDPRSFGEAVEAIFVGGFTLMWAWVCLMVYLITRWLERLRQEQRSVFAYREVTITDEAIETDSGHGTTVTKTPWTDYAYYRRHRNTIRLHLRRRGLKKRREQGSTDVRQSRFGVNLQKIDIFPRLQFENDDDWERFLWVVKHKLRRKL